MRMGTAMGSGWVWGRGQGQGQGPGPCRALTNACGALGGAGIALGAEAAVGALGVEALAVGEAEVALQALVDICGQMGAVGGPSGVGGTRHHPHAAPTTHPRMARRRHPPGIRAGTGSGRSPRCYCSGRGDRRASPWRTRPRLGGGTIKGWPPPRGDRGDVGGCGYLRSARGAARSRRGTAGTGRSPACWRTPGRGRPGGSRTRRCLRGTERGRRWWHRGEGVGGGTTDGDTTHGDTTDGDTTYWEVMDGFTMDV